MNTPEPINSPICIDYGPIFRSFEQARWDQPFLQKRLAIIELTRTLINANSSRGIGTGDSAYREAENIVNDLWQKTEPPPMP